MTTKKHQKPASRIPTFKTREEEARWFDTHDMADYQNEFKTVSARFAKNLSSVVPVRFDDRTLGKLRSYAYQRGIGPTTLIRMWVLERMHREFKHVGPNLLATR